MSSRLFLCGDNEMNLIYRVEKDNNKTINQLLKEKFNMSSRLQTKLIKNKKITLDYITCDTRICPKENQTIEVKLDLKEKNSNVKPTKMNLDIVYEDEGLLIINKTAGIAVHPSIRHYSDSLSNGVRFYFDEIGLKKKIRPINRLDLNTSGLVIFAKNEYVQEYLVKQMRDRTFKKVYICAALGKFEKKEGIINLPIARKESSIIERCVREDGQESITRYEVLKEYDDYSIVRCILETGRTHQIRVHMSYIGHPLLGDTLYGTESKLISRQALHCYMLSFVHPITQNLLELNCELPKDIKSLYNKI